MYTLFTGIFDKTDIILSLGEQFEWVPRDIINMFQRFHSLEAYVLILRRAVEKLA